MRLLVRLPRAIQLVLASLGTGAQFENAVHFRHDISRHCAGRLEVLALVLVRLRAPDNAETLLACNNNNNKVAQFELLLIFGLGRASIKGSDREDLITVQLSAE